MKLSSSSEGTNPHNFPATDWQPNDFLSKSLVDLTAPAAEGKLAQTDGKGKKILSLKDALALLQPSLVKLPIVDSPRYKKVLPGEDCQDIITVWQPLDLSSPVVPDTAAQSLDEEGISDEGEPSEAEIALSSEMMKDIEQKMAQANLLLEQAQKQADEIATQAKDKAELMLSETQSQVDQVRQNAYEEGMLEGRVQVGKQIEQITVMIKETQNWRSQILEHSEPTIIRMVQSISKKLFGNGFVLNAPEIEQMVGRAISEANRLGNLRIYVNPEDHSLLQSLWQESDLIVSGQKIQLVPSQNVVRGGCFVEGEFGSVDSRIDMQLGRLEKELDNTLSNHEQEKLRLKEFPQPDKQIDDPSLTVPGNLEALDQVRLNLGSTGPAPAPEPLQENYGFDHLPQPE